MAKAMQECPKSGLLWAETIMMASRPQRKGKSVDALRHCSNDPHVVCAVARLFMHEQKADKARSWFNRAVTLDPDVGDFWAQYYLFECKFGGKQEQEAVVARTLRADPHHGRRWARIAKSLECAHKTADFVLQKVALDYEQHDVPTA